MLSVQLTLPAGCHLTTYPTYQNIAVQRNDVQTECLGPLPSDSIQIREKVGSEVLCMHQKLKAYTQLFVRSAMTI